MAVSGEVTATVRFTLVEKKAEYISWETRKHFEAFCLEVMVGKT
jgi:hypothetical protein